MLAGTIYFLFFRLPRLDIQVKNPIEQANAPHNAVDSMALYNAEQHGL